MTEVAQENTLAEENTGAVGQVSSPTTMVETKFTFKQRTIKDENGKEIGKAKKQPALVANLPQPTKTTIAQVLQSEDPAYAKLSQLFLDTIHGIVRDQAKSQLDEVIEGFGMDDKTVTADNLDYDKLDLIYIANLEPAQRGARAITEEEFNTFFEDYANVMVVATGKPLEKIKNHIEIFRKPARVRNAKEMLQVLLMQLDLYITKTAALEDTGEVATRLRARFAKWLEEEEKFDTSIL
jgi:hypothetical protein